MPILLVILSVWFLVKIASSGRGTIPPTHETTARMAAISVCVALVFMSMLYYAWVVSDFVRANGPSVIRFAAIGLLLVPTAAIFVNYLVLQPIFAWILARKGRHNDTQKTALNIWGIFQEMLSTMRAARPVRLTERTGHQHSPYVCDAFFISPQVIVSSDISETALEACQGDTGLAQELMRLVFAHELAHIRNRDSLIVPLLGVIRYVFPVTVVALICICLLSLRMDSDLAVITKPVVGLLISSGVVLTILIHSLQNARESLADATAVLFIAPQAMQRLIGSTPENPSPLERFIVGSSMRSFRWTRYFGFISSALSPFFRLVARLFSNHSPLSIRNLREQVSARSYRFTQKELVFPNTQPALISAVVAGLAGAVIGLCVQVAKYAAFSSFMISISAGGELNWLVAMERWSSSQPEHLTLAIASMGHVLVGLTVAFVLTLPLRDSYFDLSRMTWNEWVRFGVSAVAAIVMMNVALSLGESLARPLHPTFRALQWSSFSDCIVALGATLLCVLVIAIKWSDLCTDILRTLERTVLGLGAIASAWWIILSAFDALPLDSRVLLGVVSSLLLGLALNLGLEQVLIRSVYSTHEFVDYNRFLSIRMIQFMAPSERTRTTFRHTGLALIYGLVVYAIPILLIALTAYPYLVEFNLWFGAHAGDLKTSLLAATSLPAEQAVQAVRSHWPEMFFLYLMFNFTLWGTSIVPSTAVLLIASSVVLFLVVVSFIPPLIRNSSARFNQLERIPILRKLALTLNIRLLRDDWEKKYKAAALRAVSVGRPYVNGPEYVPRMRATCDILELIPHLLNNELRKRMQFWIESCASSDGGFGYAPGKASDFVHTKSALELLRRQNIVLPEKQRQVHGEWLRREIHRLTSETSDLPGFDILQRIAYISETIEMLSLDVMTEGDCKRYTAKIEEVWRNSSRGIEATSYCLSSLCALGNTSRELIETIRSEWLPQQQNTAVQLDPKHQVSMIHHMVKVMSFLYPDTFRSNPFVEQVAENLTKAYDNRPDGFLSGLISRLLK